jgi:hypothetical protein
MLHRLVGNGLDERGVQAEERLDAGPIVPGQTESAEKGPGVRRGGPPALTNDLAGAGAERGRGCAQV